MTISRFEREFLAHTKHRARSLRGRLFAHNVVLDVAKVNTQRIRLLYIETLWGKRRGSANYAMAWLCEMADAYEIEIELTPFPYDKQGMDVVQLTAWYSTFGFHRIGCQDAMIRFPNRGEHVERMQLRAARNVR